MDSLPYRTRVSQALEWLQENSSEKNQLQRVSLELRRALCALLPCDKRDMVPNPKHPVEVAKIRSFQKHREMQYCDIFESNSNLVLGPQKKNIRCNYTPQTSRDTTKKPPSWHWFQTWLKVNPVPTIKMKPISSA